MGHAELSPCHHDGEHHQGDGEEGCDTGEDGGDVGGQRPGDRPHTLPLLHDQCKVGQVIAFAACVSHICFNHATSLIGPRLYGIVPKDAHRSGNVMRPEMGQSDLD